MKEQILLFIPMYNCEDQIVRVLKQIDEEIIKHISAVIVVNNISTDNGEKVVQQYLGESDLNIPIHILRNDENYGLGGSHKVAFGYAIDNNFDYVIVLHGDDQGNIHDLLPVLESEKYKKYDCCLGARFMRGSKLKGYSKTRILGNMVYNILFSVAAKKRLYDLGSGLNMYNVNMLKNNFYIKFPDNLVFNDCMILASDYYKHKVLFFPISWREEDQVSNVKMIGICKELLVMAFKYMINREKFIKSEFREKQRSEYSAKVVHDAKSMMNFEKV